MDKYVKKLVDVYEQFYGSDIRVHKTPDVTGSNLSKRKLKDPTDIDKYRSFIGQIMWYTMNVGPDVENSARELVVQIIHTGP